MSATAAKAFKEIEDAIKKGQSPEHFKPLLDRLLGTEVDDCDPELDSLWEQGYRCKK